MARVQIMPHLLFKTSEDMDFLIFPAAPGLNSPYKQIYFPYTLHKFSFFLVLPNCSMKNVYRKQIITAIFMTVFHILLLCFFSV